MLISGAFVRLMIATVLLTITTCACGLIDNLFIGRFLSSEALAAVGYFSPVTTAVGMAYVIILGTQVLTGNLVGAGQIRKVNKLFFSSFSVLVLLFSLFSVLCYVFRWGLAGLLGTGNITYGFLCEYIKGYAPGILPQVLTAFLIALCSFNNDLKRAYFAIGAMIASNVLGDILLVGNLGLYGIGLASTLSSIASFLVLIPGFFNRNKLFYFSFKSGFDLSLVLQAARRGIPSLMLPLGVIIKNLCFNYALSHTVGDAGVAVAGVMATVSAITGAGSAGCYNAYSTLAGIYFGEQDRESLIDLTHIALRIGIIGNAVLTALMMLLSTPFAEIFVTDDPYVENLASRMFFLGFTYLVPNVIYNIFLQSYKAQDRMLLVNIMSFAETATIGFLVLFSIRFFGSDVAWLSNTIVDVLCIFVVLISVIIYRKKIDFAMPALLKLSSDFGAKAGEVLSFSVKDIYDAVEASQKAIDFCLENGYPKTMASHIGLCIEEMAVNVIEHGFTRTINRHSDIRVVSKDGRFIVRIRDDCREFDPRKRINVFDPKDPEENIGIRIVSEFAQEISYYNNAGINTVIMSFTKTG